MTRDPPFTVEDESTADSVPPLEISGEPLSLELVAASEPVARAEHPAAHIAAQADNTAIRFMIAVYGAAQREKTRRGVTIGLGRHAMSPSRQAPASASPTGSLPVNSSAAVLL